MGRKLFEDGRADPPSPQVIRQLVEEFGYSEKAVKRWGAAQAAVTLAGVQKERGIALRRAADLALRQGRIEEAPPRGGPLPFLRLEAAKYLSEKMSTDDLCQAIMYSVHLLTDDEVKRLGGYLVKLFGANNGRVTEPVEETGRDRGESDSEPEDTPAGVEAGQ